MSYLTSGSASTRTNRSRQKSLPSDIFKSMKGSLKNTFSKNNKLERDLLTPIEALEGDPFRHSGIPHKAKWEFSTDNLPPLPQPSSNLRSRSPYPPRFQEDSYSHRSIPSGSSATHPTTPSSTESVLRPTSPNSAMFPTSTPSARQVFLPPRHTLPDHWETEDIPTRRAISKKKSGLFHPKPKRSFGPTGDTFALHYRDGTVSSTSLHMFMPDAAQRSLARARSNNKLDIPNDGLNIVEATEEKKKEKVEEFGIKIGALSTENNRISTLGPRPHTARPAVPVHPVKRENRSKTSVGPPNHALRPSKTFISRPHPSTTPPLGNEAKFRRRSLSMSQVNQEGVWLAGSKENLGYRHNASPDKRGIKEVGQAAMAAINETLATLTDSMPPSNPTTPLMPGGYPDLSPCPPPSTAVPSSTRTSFPAAVTTLIKGHATLCPLTGKWEVSNDAMVMIDTEIKRLRGVIKDLKDKDELEQLRIQVANARIVKKSSPPVGATAPGKVPWGAQFKRSDERTMTTEEKRHRMEAAKALNDGGDQSDVP